MLVAVVSERYTPWECLWLVPVVFGSKVVFFARIVGCCFSGVWKVFSGPVVCSYGGILPVMPGESNRVIEGSGFSCSGDRANSPTFAKIRPNRESDPKHDCFEGESAAADDPSSMVWQKENSGRSAKVAHRYQ